MMLLGYTWENNVTFSTDEEDFSYLVKYIPESLKPHENEVKQLMKAAWNEAKRHEALKLN